MVSGAYRDTEIGTLPVEWKVAPLDEVVLDMADGPFGSNLKKIHYTNKQEVRIIQLSNIGESGWKDENKKYTTFEHAKTISRSVVSPGNAVVAKMMPAGRAIICPDKDPMYILSSDAVKIIFNEHLLLTKFFVYITKTKIFQRQISDEIQGSTRVRTSISKLKKNYVFLPPIQEQKTIIDVISDVEELIRNIEKLIEKKKAIKKGVMQELLTGKKRLPGFIKEWTNKKLSSFFDVLKGKGLSKEKLDDHGENECILYGELFTYYKEEIKDILSRTNFYEGTLSRNFDILMPGSTTTNGYDLAKASVIYKDGVLLGGDIVIYRPKRDINSTFVAYLISLYKNDIIKYTQGITIIHLQGEKMLEMDIKIPSDIEEQNAIVQVLTDINMEIEQLQEKLNKYQKIKQGMMDELLTGKTRLI